MFSLEGASVLTPPFDQLDVAGETLVCSADHDLGHDLTNADTKQTEGSCIPLSALNYEPSQIEDASYDEAVQIIKGFLNQIEESISLQRSAPSQFPPPQNNMDAVCSILAERGELGGKAKWPVSETPQVVRGGLFQLAEASSSSLLAAQMDGAFDDGTPTLPPFSLPFASPSKRTRPRSQALRERRSNGDVDRSLAFQQFPGVITLPLRPYIGPSMRTERSDDTALANLTALSTATGHPGQAADRLDPLEAP
ncbi:hypothetical protein B0T25DRAFT_572947 [Lasiosphaeria hispida]|uniref:Uncharacterized protein n=1 Tax=Lasiosphaeria hispida TaxID=260671 RepID=A0AAJ0H9G1_9PEZI|nr:hypothetical protein B0T25DRAFT_572947 [Lasiosphaeria hispida]